MPSLPVLRQLFREITSRKDSWRIPEPSLVMEDANQVASFHEAGREDGVMAPLYLFHSAQVCEVVKPGDTVIDLGCGPANQLGQIASLNPDVNFIGVDLSEEMLDMAERNLQAKEIRNVTLKRGDITDLRMFDSGSANAIMTTVVLHHLPDEAALFRCFSEVERVLKPGGGLYLVDFAHLKTEAAIHYFAYQYEGRQPEIFTIDYLNSLRAAFELPTWRAGWSNHLRSFGNLYSTFMVPYMVAAKSSPRRELPNTLRKQLNELYWRMPTYQQTDFNDLATFFRFSGLKSPKIDYPPNQ